MASLDVSSLLGMLSGDGVSALGKSADAKKSQVSSVLDSALPLLLTGMKNNASTKAGASSLNKALKDHAKDDTSDIGSFLQNVDLSDGGKILKKRDFFRSGDDDSLRSCAAAAFQARQQQGRR